MRIKVMQSSTKEYDCQASIEAVSEMLAKGQTLQFLGGTQAEGSQFAALLRHDKRVVATNPGTGSQIKIWSRS